MNNKKYTHIKKVERLEIAYLLAKQYSLRNIAGILKKNVSTISREIKKNSVLGIYDPKIRQYISKGSDISQYSDDYIQTVQDKLNNRPRKYLGYKTPKEVIGKNHQLK